MLANSSNNNIFTPVSQINSTKNGSRQQVNVQLGQASSKGTNISIKSSNPKIQQNNLLYSPERRPGLQLKEEMSESKDYAGVAVTTANSRVNVSTKHGGALKASQGSLTNSLQNQRDETSRGRKFQES